MKPQGVLAGAAALAILSGAAWAGPKVDWHWSVHGNPRAFTVGIDTLAAYVKQRTNGDFNVQVHYGESISPAKEVLDSIKVGAIEGGIMCISYAPGKAPLQGVLDLPFLPFANLEVQRQVHEAVYKHPAIEKEMKQWNGFSFFSALLPQYEFMGVGDPPRKLDDWKGMRVRALAGLGEAMRVLGAVPTTVPSPETYTALERGVVQAVSLPFSYAHAAYRLEEVSKWYTLGMRPGTVNCPLVLSLSAWDRLPAEYRDLLQEAKPGAYAAMVKAYKEVDEKNIPMFDKTGLQRLTYSDAQHDEFQKAAGKPVWDRWVAEMKGKGLPGQELLDFVLAQAKKAGGSS